jgi:hypothetical protein
MDNLPIDFESRVEAFRAAVEAKLADTYTTPQTVSLMPGRRYIRVVVGTMDDRRAFGFIDKVGGKLLKAAGGKAPAKGVRGSIWSDDMGLARCNVYGGIA